MPAEGRDVIEPEIPLEREGQYTRLEELGRGGQSVVLRAFDQFITREVALKELAISRTSGESDSTPTVSGERAARERRRFLREARLTGRLDHPGIVSVLELARRPDGTIFCAQKLVRGETLKQRLARCSSPSDRLQLLPHLVAACQAVAYAHSHGVIHRDLKPANIMVGPFGETVVVDWGLAKRQAESEETLPPPSSSPELGLTAEGAALGTPQYMSPEQARGDLRTVDARSDVFSLGAILYEILGGRPPVTGATFEHVLENASAGKFHPIERLAPDAPPELAAITERALQVRPAERYADAEELARDLSAYLAGGWVRAYKYRTWELFRKFAASHRALLGGIAIALVALLVSSGVVVTRLHQTRLGLASSFLERGYRSEQEGDWSAAAAYFAAARDQHDTSEERWGLAVASQRIAERILSRQGPAGSFTDVGVLPDGRVITLAQGSSEVSVREAESGRMLWARSGEPVLEAVILPGPIVRLTHQGAWAFHDAANGREVLSWPRSRGFPCPGAFPPPVSILDGQLLAHSEGAEPRIVATDTASTPICAVSSDGRQVIYVVRTFGMRLLSLVDGREVRRRDPEPFRTFQFTPRGLVVFRQGRLDVLAGPEGDFSIELPEARFGTASQTPLIGGAAVSPDGELVALASREGATRATVVDLGSRSIRGVVHYARGWPRFVFSTDGRRLFAAGLKDGSVLGGWQLPPSDMPRRPRWWTHGFLSPSGGTALFWNAPSGHFEMFRLPETLIGSGVRDLGNGTRIVGDQAVGFITSASGAVVLLDPALNRVIWEHPCRLCSDLSVAEDGALVVQVGADGLEVWNTRTNKLLFQETRRTGASATQSSISPDGSRIAWTFGNELFVRDLHSGQERELSLDGPARELRFGPDGRHLLAITAQTLTLWEETSDRALWSVPKELPDEVSRLQWSPDGRAVIASYGFSATEVLDSRTGERLGWFQSLPRVVTPVRAEILSPDLRTKGSAAERTWDTLPMPQPEDTPADQSLARMLQKTGLQFKGVELVAAP